MRHERSRRRRPGWRFAVVAVFGVFGCVLTLSAGVVNIKRVSTDKARYDPTGSSPVITVEIVNDGTTPWSGTVELEIFHLASTLHMTSSPSPTTTGGSIFSFERIGVVLPAVMRTRFLRVMNPFLRSSTL